MAIPSISISCAASELDGKKHDNEPPAGNISNVSIRNVIAHGDGTSEINGHPDSWLDNIHFDNVRLFVSRDPDGRTKIPAKP